MLGILICDAFELLILLRKLTYREEKILNEVQAFHLYHIIILHILAATNMKWIEAKMKVSVRQSI